MKVEFSTAWCFSRLCVMYILINIVGRAMCTSCLFVQFIYKFVLIHKQYMYIGLFCHVLYGIWVELHTDSAYYFGVCMRYQRPANRMKNTFKRFMTLRQ